MQGPSYLGLFFICCSGRGFGILFILLGSTLYTYVKDLEQRQKEQIASHGRDSPALSCSTSSSRSLYDEKPRGISSAHNSPVLSSSSTFESISSLDSHSRSSTMNLGVNVGLANSTSGSTIPSPRTPNSLLNRQINCNITPPERIPLSDSERKMGLSQPSDSPRRGLSFDTRTVSSTSSLHSTSSKRAGHQQNGRSFQGSRSGNSGTHEKSASVTDLQDVLIAPSKQSRHKEGKVY